MEYFGTPTFVGDLDDIVVDGISFQFEVVEEQEYDEAQYTLIFTHELSNGQFLSVAFIENDFYTYNISLNIANTFGYSRLWHFVGSPDDETTGTCGLEGLKKAFKLVKWFAHEILPDGHSLTIYSEGKRTKAYRFLKRIGFDEKFTAKGTELGTIGIFEYENGNKNEQDFLFTLTDINTTLDRINAY